MTAPTLVVHGEADPMQSVRAGRATADAIPGARLVTYPGMGHDLPRALWPSIIDEIRALGSSDQFATRLEPVTATADAATQAM